MGQHSSKRRSHSFVKGKDGNSATQPRENADDTNGSLEPHVDQNITTSPTSPTSASSVSPSSTPGKKEKRRRFRVGFSLKRTPSGRWSRKKKTSSMNGARPVSCPEPLLREQHENPGRPQSLFLEELDIQEEDNKIETVDLSDNEDGKTKPRMDSKSTPKVPEKSKWNRGSNKKSSGKKKKKEKQSPKKDKKKKQKAGEGTAEHVQKTEETIQVQATTATTSEKEEVVESVTKDNVKDLQVSDSQKDDGVEAIAASIVAQTVQAAQERLRSESINEQVRISPVEQATEPVSSEDFTSEHVRTLTDTADVSPEDVAFEVTEEIPATKSVSVDSAEKLAQDIIAEIMDKSIETVTESSADIDSHTEPQKPDQTEHIIKEDTQVPENNNEASSQSESTVTEQVSVPYFSQDITENVVPIQPEEIAKDILSTNNDAYEEVEKKQVGVDESEVVAKRIVEHVISAAVQAVYRKEENTEDTDKTETSKLEGDSEKSKIISENFTIEAHLAQGTEHNEEKQIEPAHVEDGTKEGLLEKKQKKTEEKSDGKSKKEKMKGEGKIKVPKKLSNWFHKKNKHQKPVSETGPELPGGDHVAHATGTDSLHHVPEPNLEHVNVDHETVDSQSPVSESPTLEVNEDPLVTATQSPAELSPDSNETTSPSSSSVSPTSPTSESDDPAVPVSTDEKKSGFLKKISLGPRLKTAILRKKSSGASDDHGKDKQVKSTECSVLTPPPRKGRHQKSKEQHSPSSPGTGSASSTDTSPYSPHDTGNSTHELAAQPESSEANLTINDSGVADLTSPEGEKSDFTFGDDRKTDNVVSNKEETSAFINAPRETVANVNTDNSIDTKETLQNKKFKDNTRPPQLANTDEVYLESEFPSTSPDYYSPLDSPTLVSTAVIILRSTSNEERVTMTDLSFTGETDTDTRELSEDSLADFSKEKFSSSTSESTSIPSPIKEQDSPSSILPNSETSSIQRVQEQALTHDAEPSKNKKGKFFDDKSRVRTIREYQIGFKDDLETNAQATADNTYQISVLGDSETSNNDKENSSQFEKNEVFQREKDTLLELHNAGNFEQNMDGTNSLKVRGDGLTIWQITCCSDNANNSSNVRVNGLPETSLSNETAFVVDSTNCGDNRILELSDQEQKGCKDNSDADETRPTVKSSVYLVLQKDEVTNGD